VGEDAFEERFMMKDTMQTPSEFRESGKMMQILDEE
jgi:hypothetical protein